MGTFNSQSLISFRTFVTAWQSALRTHEQMAENRLRFAQRLNEMSQELSTLAKEVDFSRKQVNSNNVSPYPCLTASRPRISLVATRRICKIQKQ